MLKVNIIGSRISYMRKMQTIMYYPARKIFHNPLSSPEERLQKMQKRAEWEKKEMDMADEIMKAGRSSRVLADESSFYGPQLKRYPQRKKLVDDEVQKGIAR